MEFLPKGVFDCLELVKIAGKFFRGKNSFLLSSNANEVIRAVLNSLFFLRKDFTHTRILTKRKMRGLQTKSLHPTFNQYVRAIN